MFSALASARATVEHVEVYQAVSCVLDDMLVDLESWSEENQRRQYRSSLASKQAEIAELQQRLNVLEQQQAQGEEHTRRRTEEAKEIRDGLVSELWNLSKRLNTASSADKKLKKAEKDMQKLGRLERELENAQREIAHYRSGGAPAAAVLVADPPEKMITWIQGALGGSKWKAEAEKYALELHQAKVSSLERAHQLSAAQLRERGLPPAHATLIAAAPLPGSPLSEYAAPLMVVEDKALLKIFSFLDAGSVLSTALVCRPFFTRVDGLFGMQSSIVSNPTPASDAKSRAGSMTDAAAGSAAATEVKGGLTAALATQIAAKLNSTEMKAIIQMTERIKKLQGHAGSLKEAKEDTEQRLQATESVKDFLVNKLRDTEVALKRTMDAANDTAKQIKSDQEIISYLDNRVKDLEKQLNDALSNKSVAEDRLSAAEEGTRKQVQQLEAHLQWEKERSTKQENEARSQKKLLVKEVKALRLQLSQMQTERDAYKQQARTLQLRGTKDPF